MLTKSLEIDISVYGELHSATAISYDNLGGLYSDLGDHQKAMEMLTKSLENTHISLRRAALSHGDFLQQPRDSSTLTWETTRRR